MRSLLILSYRDIKKNLLSSIVTFLLLLFSVMMFSMGLSILFNTSSPLTQMFQETKASDENLMVSEKIYDVASLEEWWKERDEIDRVEVYNMDSGVKLAANNKDSEKVYFTEKLADNKQNKLKVIDGEKKSVPYPGTVWIPSSLADLSKIKVGDTIETIKDGDRTKLKVSAIIVDPYFSASMINPKRIWVNETDFSRVTDSQSDEKILAIKYNDYEKDGVNVWEDFIDSLPSTFLGVHYKIDLVSYVYNIQFSLIGGILLFFSLVIVIVSLFIVKNSIKNSIAQDTKDIGILSSLGFSIKQIRGKYFIKYSILLVLAFPLGIIASVFPVMHLMDSLLGSIGGKSNELTFLLPMILVVLIFILLLILTVMSATRIIKSISIVDAILDRKSTKQKKKKTSASFNGLPLPWMLAMKQIVTDKKSFRAPFVSILTLSVVLTFSLTLITSLDNLYSNRGYWGFSNADFLVTMTPAEKDSIVEKLENDSDIQGMTTMDQYTSVGMNKKYEQSASFFATVFDGSLDAIKQPNIKGKNPKKAGEISLALNSSKKYEKEIGDNIEIIVNGKKADYKVVGIYQTIDAAGEGFRVSDADIKDLDPDFSPQSYYIKLDTGVNSEDFIKNLEDEYGDAIEVTNMKKLVNNQINQAVVSAKGASVFLTVIVIIVSLINIFGSLITKLFADKKDIGIYKSVGFDNLKITSIYIIQNVIVSFCALVIGFVVTELVKQKVFNFIIGNVGLGEFPTATNYGLLFLVCVIVLLLIIGICFISLSKIKKISSRELTSE